LTALTYMQYLREVWVTKRNCKLTYAVV